MLRNLRKKLNQKKRKKGFTLIELVIVIAIIAILAAIALPKFSAIKENANKKADIANGKSIQSAITIAAQESTTIAALLPTTTVTATFTTAGSPISVAGTPALKALVSNIEKGKTKNYTTQDFQVGVDANGNVLVFLNGNEVYPEQHADFK